MAFINYLIYIVVGIPSLFGYYLSYSSIRQENEFGSVTVLLHGPEIYGLGFLSAIFDNIVCQPLLASTLKFVRGFFSSSMIVTIHLGDPQNYGLVIIIPIFYVTLLIPCFILTLISFVYDCFYSHSFLLHIVSNMCSNFADNDVITIPDFTICETIISIFGPKQSFMGQGLPTYCSSHLHLSADRGEDHPATSAVMCGQPR